MGVLLPPQPCCPDDVSVRALTDTDWDAVRRIYNEGIATRNATFETEVPTRKDLDAKWLAEHRWVAEVVGWAALSPVSTRDCYRGVAEASVYVADGMRGRGVGKALVRTQVITADQAGLRTLQTPIFPSTGPASPCTTPQDSAPSASANASPNSTATGATPSSSNADAPLADSAPHPLAAAAEPEWGAYFRDHMPLTDSYWNSVTVIENS